MGKTLKSVKCEPPLSSLILFSIQFFRALESLFSTLKSYGPSFSEDFWDTVFRELIFPIFAVLKSAADVSRFSTQDDMAVWFSTTMVEALRNVIDLYSHHFDLLGRTFEGLLDLLSTCVCQGEWVWLW